MITVSTKRLLLFRKCQARRTFKNLAHVVVANRPRFARLNGRDIDVNWLTKKDQLDHAYDGAAKCVVHQIRFQESIDISMDADLLVHFPEHALCGGFAVVEKPAWQPKPPLTRGHGARQQNDICGTHARPEHGR